jgi:hypothetical protein
MSTDRVSATRRITATAHDIFMIVSNPARHPEIDGSGMLQATTDPKPLTRVGQVFGMDMDRRPLGDIPNMGEYQVRNIVTRLVPDRLLEWTVRAVGKPPVGHVYGWEIDPVSDSDCFVTKYCDWTNVNEEWRAWAVSAARAADARRPWPILPVEMLERSVENLERIATTAEPQDASHE